MALDTVPPTSNQSVVDLVRAHHTELADQLHERTWAVLSSARTTTTSRDWPARRDALHAWYRDELLPHIVAEEQALYSAASEVDATRLLVCGMLTEHRSLVSLVADLAMAREPFETAIIAAAAQALLVGHLGKENDLLLPALDTAGLDLGALLDGLHEVLGHAESCGGGACGCHHGTETRSVPVPVDIVVAPSTASDPDSDAELDVRTLPHGRRHEIIFARLDALPLGAELVIVNDHDPKPLRYQTEALWPGRFTWTYRQAGAQVWRVAITRAE